MTAFCPDYYSDFSCAMGGCPESCCKAGWEIPIDRESYEFYRAAGVDIDENSYICEDGDRVFRLRDDRSCVYLNDSGLCELYIKTGGRQCEICAKYPRFFEEYPDFTEAGLSLSCPVAEKIILREKGFSYENIAKKSEDRLLDFLLYNRFRAMKMIFAEPEPDSAASKLLGFGEDLQELIDYDELGRADEVGFEPAEPFSADEMTAARRFIAEKTEVLDPKWRELLLEGHANAGSADERRNYLLYLTFRYFPKALDTEDIAAQCGFILLLYQLAGSLSRDFEDAVRHIVKEIGHNAENYKAVRGIIG